MANLGEVVVQIRAEMAQFKRAFKDASRQLMSFTRTSRAALARLSGAVVAFSANVARHIGRSLVRNLRRAAIAMAALGVASVKVFADFETGMAKVSTLLSEQSMHLLPQFKDQIQALSIEMGQSVGTLSDALFDIVSAQIPAAEAFAFLQQATKAATAGFTESKTVTSAMITVMKAYKMEASDAARISDVLFQTMVQGRVTFEDVAAGIGEIAAQAAIAKIDLESMTTTFAIISRVLDPFKAKTAVRALYVELGKVASADQIRVAKELGIEWESSSFKGEKLRDTLIALGKANEEQLSILSPNIRSLAGLATAMQEASDTMRTYNEIVNSGGSVATAYAKAIDTMNFSLSRMKQAILAVMRVAVEPFAASIVDATEKMANFLRDSQMEVEAWATVVGHNLKAIATFVSTDFVGALKFGLEAGLELFKEFVVSVIDMLGVGLVDGIKAAIMGIPDAIIEGLTSIDDIIKTRLAHWSDSFVHAIKGNIGESLISMTDALAPTGFGFDEDATKGAIDRTVSRFADAGEKIKADLEAKMGGLGLKLKDFATEHARIMTEEYSKMYLDMFETVMTYKPGAAGSKAGAVPEDVVPANAKAAESVKTVWQGTADSIAGAMSGAFADITTRAKSMTEALTDMLNQIHRALSQEVFKRMIMPGLFPMLGLPVPGATAPTGQPQPFEPHARGGLVGQGMGRVMYAASGLMVPRGGDTVPIMATPGEEVVEKPIVDYIKRTQAQPPAMTINVNSVTGRDAYAFLNDNKRTIASMMQSAMSGNHPLRRDR